MSGVYLSAWQPGPVGLAPEIVAVAPATVSEAVLSRGAGRKGLSAGHGSRQRGESALPGRETEPLVAEIIGGIIFKSA